MDDMRAIYEQLIKESNKPKKKVKSAASENVIEIGPNIDKVVWSCDRDVGPKHRYEVMFPRGKIIKVNISNIPKSCWCGGKVKIKTYVYQNFMSLIAEGTPIKVTY